MLKQKYAYHPIPGGIAITNGKADYVRPLYAPHCHDVLNGKRYIYYVGDRPKLVLSNAAAGSTNKLLARHGHLFLGLRGGKWLHDMDEITARYVYGHEEYDIRDVSFDGTIKLTFTRTPALDAMLIRAELPQSAAGRLLFFAAGQNGKPGCQPRGGDSDNLRFQAADTAGNQVTMAGNVYRIRRNGADLCGAVSCDMSWYVADAAAFGDDPDALLQSVGSSTPAAVGVQRDTAQTVYLMLTTEPADNPYVQNFQAQAAQLFADGLAHYKALAQTIEVDTPEPYFDSAVAAQLVALDASWDAGVMRGPIAWHSGQSGWRGMYGFVTAGWGERVKENVRLYMKTQHEDGRIECYPDGDQRYNMGETLVDELLTYWLYSGDTKFFAESGYDFVAKFLHHQDTQLRVPGTDLYENFLNAWNTDSITLPIHASGDKIYFMLSVSTNGMQSHIENARITVRLADGTTEVLPLTNPDNIDDWLCYQERHDSDWGSSNECRPYAKTGYEQFFGKKAHANILAVDLHGEKQIEEIKLETLSCEVLTGLLGVTVAKAVN